jgi:hypothetical protein
VISAGYRGIMNLFCLVAFLLEFVAAALPPLSVTVKNIERVSHVMIM